MSGIGRGELKYFVYLMWFQALHFTAQFFCFFDSFANFILQILEGKSIVNNHAL